MNTSDRRLIVTCLALLILAAVYVTYNYDAAFPQASLSLPLSRDAITGKAEAFLRMRGLAPSADFRNLTLFDPDELARLYLERELGIEKANELMSGTVPVWRWRARWFQPPEKEERIVWLRPDGSLTGFEHRILDTASGRRLDRASARLLAKAFLDAQTSAPHELIAEESVDRPNRTDHQFTWEQSGFKAAEATLRRTVIIQGDRVGRYQEALHVPEQWERDFATLRSGNELYAAIANGLYVVLVAAALLLLLLNLRQRIIPWRPLLRIAGLVSAFYFLNELNTLAFAVDRMPTSTRYPEMLILSILQGLGAAAGILIYVLTPAAAGVGYRLPFAMPGSRSYFRGAVAGYGMAGAHMIFLTAFYLYGAQWGVWSPQEVDYSDLLATPLPWVYPIAIALMASTAEEFWFRWLAIPLMERVVRLRWVAIVIPAFVWGFLHANYPQQPSYIRGLEVGLIGVAAGWMMLRFGIVATLVWHYVIDAFLIGMFLFRAEAWQYRVSAVIVALAIVAPVLVSLVLYRRNRGFVEDRDALGVPPPPPPPVVQEDHSEGQPVWEPPPAPRLPLRYLYYTAAGLAVVALLARPVTIGNFIRIDVTRAEAIAKAEAAMRQRGLDPANWRVTADFTVNLRDNEAEYLRQHVGLARTNEFLRDGVLTAIWRVRYFQPLKPEQWRFYVNQSGELVRFDHVLDEKAPGANLTPAEARAIAEAYLSKRHKIDTYRLVESSEEKRDRRTDHTFTYEDPSFQAGEAKYRVSLHVVGDQPCEYRPYLYLPETWLRDYRRPRLTSYLLPALIGALGVTALLAFLKKLTSDGVRLHWKTYALPALALAALGAGEQLNAFPIWLAGYDIATPLEHHWVQLLTGAFTGVLITGVGVFVLLLVADVFLQMAYPGLFRRRVDSRPPLGRGVAVAVLAASAASLLAWMRQQMPGPHRGHLFWELPGLNNVAPGVTALTNSAVTALLVIAMGVIAVCGALALTDRRGRLRLLGAVVLATAIGQALTPVQVPFLLGMTLFGLAVAAAVVLTCGADLVAVGCGLFLAMVIPDAIRFAGQAANGFVLHAAVIAMAALGVMAYLYRSSTGTR